MTQLENGLARIGRRVQSRRTQAQADRTDLIERLQAHPDLAYLAHVAWNDTGPNGGLLWVKLDGYERGRDLPPGIIPAYYEVNALERHRAREKSLASEAQETARPRKGPRRVAKVLRKKRP